MKPKRDAGVDIWASGGRYGDCEDYALTKRDLLIRSGWPSDALAMTVVKTPWGEGHAVLSVRTSRGTLVLDNLTYEIKKLKTTPYRVVAMQSADPLKWVGGTRF
jgi:predicted transglutaminase-like cysteine proteinase